MYVHMTYRQSSYRDLGVPVLPKVSCLQATLTALHVEVLEGGIVCAAVQVLRL
jgi:hypothetical protein